MKPTLGCGLRGLATLTPSSVGLLLTDLPSGQTRAKFDVPVCAADMGVFWARAWWALRPGGNVVLFASSLPFAVEVIASQPHCYRYDLIWSKSIKTGFLNAKHRQLRSHEHVLVFSRSGRATYNLQMTQGHGPVQSNGRKGAKGSENYDTLGGNGAGKSRVGATDRFPSSVLCFNSVGVRHPSRKHPQQKPEGLLRYLVRTYSNPGDLVVDPFAGSGSTGVAAVAEGRTFAGWDSDLRFGVASG